MICICKGPVREEDISNGCQPITHPQNPHSVVPSYEKLPLKTADTFFLDLSDTGPLKEILDDNQSYINITLMLCIHIP